MSSELTLLLVRHGETAWNAERRWQGMRDVPLSEMGRAQAARLRERLRIAWRDSDPALPAAPTHLFSSDLSRARETAHLLADALPSPLPLIQTPLLRERSYGAWEGLTMPEIHAKFGVDAVDDTREPWESVAARMDAALTLIRSHIPSGVALVVGHGGALRHFLTYAMGAPIETAQNFRLDNVSLSVVTLFEDVQKGAVGRIQLVNDTAHFQRGYGER